MMKKMKDWILNFFIKKEKEEQGKSEEYILTEEEDFYGRS